MYFTSKATVDASYPYPKANRIGNSRLLATSLHQWFSLLFEDCSTISCHSIITHRSSDAANPYSTIHNTPPDYLKVLQINSRRFAQLPSHRNRHGFGSSPRAGFAGRCPPLRRRRRGPLRNLKILASEIRHLLQIRRRYLDDRRCVVWCDARASGEVSPLRDLNARQLASPSN